MVRSPGRLPIVDLLAPLPVEPYNIVPFTSLDERQLDAIVKRHRLSIDGPVVPILTNGVVHALWALGSSYVLRVPKREPMCLDDLRAEVAAIPVALIAGVRTPALVTFDDAICTDNWGSSSRPCTPRRCPHHTPGSENPNSRTSGP